MTDYYVSQSGSDSSSGLIVDGTPAPWASIQKGLDALTAGDTLYIMEGTYNPGDDPNTHKDQYWHLSASGTSSNGITVTNYSTDTVTLTGLADGASSGYPKITAKDKERILRVDEKKNNFVGFYWTWQALFELIDCKYVTVSNLNIIDSTGRGMLISGEKKTYSDGSAAHTSRNITVDNCRIHNTRQRNIEIEGTWDTTVSDSEFSFGSWALYGDGAAGLSTQAAYYTFIDGNVFHQQCGEVVETDSNNWGSSHTYIRNNVFFDSEAPILLHATDHVICTGNFIYNTPQESDAQTDGSIQEFGFRGNKGITVKTSECDMSKQRGTSYVLVAHNVIVNRKIGIVVIAEKGCTQNTMDHIYITNNTVVNSTSYNYGFLVEKATNSVFKNNISVHSAAKNHVNNRASETPTGWDADYNLYSTTPTMHANLKGSNDVYNSDPSLEGTDPPTKGTMALTEYYRYWANFDLKTGYDDATNFRIQTGSTAKEAGVALTAPAGWNSDAYAEDMSDYIDVSYDFGITGTDPARPSGALWDIGAHEFGADGDAGRPTATALVETATSYAADVDEEIDFTGASAGGTGASTYLWDFGDGSDTTTTQNPSHTYKSSGYYIATLTVTDSKGLKDKDTVTVTVTQDVAGGDAGTVKFEQDIVTAGTASYTVSGTPKAIIALATMGKTDDTPVNDSWLSMGVWSDDGSQYCAAFYGQHGQTTTYTRSNNIDGGILYYLRSGGDTSKIVTVDSVTSNTVNLTWPDNHDSEKVIFISIYGDKVSGAQAAKLAFSGSNRTASYAGDYNFAFIPAAYTSGFSQSTYRGNISLGIAARDVGEICHNYRNRNNQGTTKIFAKTTTSNRIAESSGGDYMSVDSWDATGITGKVNGTLLYPNVPMLLLDIEDAEIKLGSIDTPTSVTSTDYTTSIDGEFLFLFGGLSEALETEESDDSASSFTIHVCDNGDVEHTIAISSDDGTSPSDESSYYADDWREVDSSGADIADGALSNIATGFNITPTNADSTAYKKVYCQIEKLSAAADLAADFTYYKSGTNPADNEIIRAGDTVQFRDLSVSEADTVDDWDWDFGDTNTSASQHPTNAYSLPGKYTVTLDVEDDGANTDSTPKEIVIEVAPPTIGFDRGSDITPAGGSGSTPLSFEVDLSGIAAGTGSTIDYVQLIVTPRVGEITGGDVQDESILQGIEPPAPQVLTGDPSDTFSGTLDVTYAYDIQIDVYYENSEDVAGSEFHEAVFVVTETDTTAIEIRSNYGKGRCPTGPITFDFVAHDGETALEDGDHTRYASIDWDFGDGDNSTDWEPSHEYAAVSSATARDVEVTVTAWDGTEYTVTETAYATIYPPVVAPPTLADLSERVTNLMAVDYLDGTWVQESAPNTSVWKHTESMPWATATTVRVIEDGTELTSRASVALCQANAGSYYVASTGPLVVYVHPTASGNPNTNGLTYRWLYA